MLARSDVYTQTGAPQHESAKKINVDTEIVWYHQNKHTPYQFPSSSPQISFCMPTLQTWKSKPWQCSHDDAEVFIAEIKPWDFEVPG